MVSMFRAPSSSIKIQDLAGWFGGFKLLYFKIIIPVMLITDVVDSCGHIFTSFKIYLNFYIDLIKFIDLVSQKKMSLKYNEF